MGAYAEDIMANFAYVDESSVLAILDVVHQLQNSQNRSLQVLK
jgi:hypothetical protein